MLWAAPPEAAPRGHSRARVERRRFLQPLDLRRPNGVARIVEPRGNLVVLALEAVSIEFEFLAQPPVVIQVHAGDLIIRRLDRAINRCIIASAIAR
jgi:hypothetical protein